MTTFITVPLFTSRKNGWDKQPGYLNVSLVVPEMKGDRILSQNWKIFTRELSLFLLSIILLLYVTTHYQAILEVTVEGVFFYLTQYAVTSFPGLTNSLYVQYKLDSFTWLHFHSFYVLFFNFWAAFSILRAQIYRTFIATAWKCSNIFRTHYLLTQRATQYWNRLNEEHKRNVKSL